MTPKDLANLALHNPVVAACFTEYRYGKVTYEEMLLKIVVMLAAENKLYKDWIAKVSPLLPPKPIMSN